MDVLLAVRCRKKVVEEGKWSDRKMARPDFPLSKSKTYLLGVGWQWQVWKLSGAGLTFRMLVAFHPGRGQFQGWLGLLDGQDLAILAKMEHHMSHRGWHLHVRRGVVSTVARGVVKESRTHERVRICATQTGFDVTQSNAAAIALRVFNVELPNLDVFG